ncbi:hypothetical protein HK102_006658 [Quaeritorhiza haematococci]|nr:hypothetical protein HK102_006658 [Quaeritorhiza haematococci]
MLLWSAFLEEGEMAKYGKPVLQMSGERDGQCRITRMWTGVREFAEARKAKGDAWPLQNVPVVVMPKITHSQFTNIPRLQNEKPDLPPIISTQEAHTTIASIASSFIALNSANTPEQYITKARTTLSQSLAETQRLLTGYSRALSTDQNAVCSTAQRILATEQFASDLQVLNTVYGDVGGFARSKPSVAENGTVLTTSMAFYPRFFPFNRGSEPQSPDTLACKCESNESVAKSKGVAVQGQAGDCQEVMARILEDAKKLLTPEQLERYETSGLKLRAAKESDMKNAGFTWLPAGPVYKRVGSGEDVAMEVAAAALRTGIDTPFGK